MASVKVLPSLPATVHKDAPQKIITFKSRCNIEKDKKTSDHGLTDFHTLDGNTSICVKIDTDRKDGMIIVTPYAKDNYGSLSHYVIENDDGTYVVLLENLLSEPRSVRLSYLIFYD